jgi:hypothetical protein
VSRPEDLKDPSFLAYVRGLFPEGIEPDEGDLDRDAPARSTEEAISAYKAAQRRKLIRLYREWMHKFSAN